MGIINFDIGFEGMGIREWKAVGGINDGLNWILDLLETVTKLQCGTEMNNGMMDVETNLDNKQWNTLMGKKYHKLMNRLVDYYFFDGKMD